MLFWLIALLANFTFAKDNLDYYYDNLNNLTSNLEEDQTIDQSFNEDSNYSFHSASKVQKEKVPHMIKGYNAAFRPEDERESMFSIGASFIYFQPREDNLDIGSGIKTNTKAATGNIATILRFNPDYKYGFKVMFGWKSTFDNWFCGVDYMRYHPKNSQIYDIAIYDMGVKSNWLRNPNPVTLNISGFVYGKLKLLIDLFNLKLGRNGYLGKQLIFNPYIGLLTGCVKQRYIAKFGPGSLKNPTYKTNSKINSFVIGPKLGIDINWYLSKKKNFRIFGCGATAIVHQYFKTTVTEEKYSGSSLSDQYRNIDREGFFNPILDLSLGIGFTGKFGKERKLQNYYFDLSASYDFMHLFNQNMMTKLVARSSNEYNAPNSASDLTLHGPNVHIKFDF